MVQVDLSNIRIRCRACGYVKDLDMFEIPLDVECCDDPDIILDDEIEITID